MSLMVRVHVGMILLEVIVALAMLMVLWLGVLQIQVACTHQLACACERIRLLAIVHRYIGMIQVGGHSAYDHSIVYEGCTVTVTTLHDPLVPSVRWVTVCGRRHDICVELRTAVRS